MLRNPANGGVAGPRVGMAEVLNETIPFDPRIHILDGRMIEPYGHTFALDKASFVPTKQAQNFDNLYVADNGNNQTILCWDFESYACNGRVGLDPRVAAQLPAQIQQRGVNDQEWSDWMLELSHITETWAPSRATEVCALCFPGLWVQAGLCVCFCPLKSCEGGCEVRPGQVIRTPCLPCVGGYHRRLHAWMAKVNRELNQKHMHVKFFTYREGSRDSFPATRNKARRIADWNDGISGMKIALDDGSSNALRNTGWDIGWQAGGCIELGAAV